MARDKSKIFAEDVHVWVAPAGTGGSPPDAKNYTELGWCEAAQTKLTPKERSTITLHDNTPHHLGSTFLFEAMALETNAAKLQALEALEELTIDIVLSKVHSPENGYLLTTMNVVVEPEMAFDRKTPLKIKFEASHTARRLSDFFSEQTAMLNFT